LRGVLLHPELMISRERGRPSSGTPLHSNPWHCIAFRGVVSMGGARSTQEGSSAPSARIPARSRCTPREPADHRQPTADAPDCRNPLSPPS
jgi:hypothetical protein